MKKSGFTRRADALEYERDMLAKESGNLDMTFGALADLYMAGAKPRLRPTTYDAKVWTFEKKILPYFRDQNVTDITPAKIRKWQAEMISQGYAQTYLKTINSQMTAVFNFAVKYYSLPQNPAIAAGSMGKRNADDMDFWTLDEFERFIAGMDGDPTARMAFNLLFWTGMREGELLALTLNDVDFKRSGVHIRRIYTRLGHEKVSMTLGTYSHLYPDRGQALAYTLGDLKAQHGREAGTAAPPVYDDPPTPEPDF